MSEHLVFLLYAPLAAMGGVAVGEQRAGFDRPAKSAILGLIAAALGLDRNNEAAHRALAEGYRLGLGEISRGRLLLDYHTAQAPPQRRSRSFATRREELARKDDLGTVLSVREYRTDLPIWSRFGPKQHRAGSLASSVKLCNAHTLPCTSDASLARSVFPSILVWSKPTIAARPSRPISQHALPIR